MKALDKEIQESIFMKVNINAEKDLNLKIKQDLKRRKNEKKKILVSLFKKL